MIIKLISKHQIVLINKLLMSTNSYLIIDNCMDVFIIINRVPTTI